MKIALARCTASTAATLVLFCSSPSASARAPEQEPEAIADAEAEPPADDAPATERAEYWFGRGEQLGRAGDLIGAARAFERSIEVIPTANALYNRAVAYEFARMLLEALAAYRDYLAFVDADSAEAEAGQQAVARLRAQVGTIAPRFERGHVPQQIYVDGKLRRPDEFPLFVLPGAHEVVVVERDGERRDRQQRLEAGSVWDVDFTRPAPAASGPSFRPAPAFDEGVLERRRRITRSLFYTTVALTGAAAVGVGVFGGLTLRERKAFKAGACGTQMECLAAGNPDYPADHERRFRNLKTTTNVLIGASVGLAAITLVLGVVGFVEPSTKGARARRRVRLEPSAAHLRF